MKEKKQVLKGEEGFNSYYSELFGERWNSLKESFFKENQSVEYKVRNAEKSYFLDSASIFAALNLPVKGAKNILDLCAAPGGKTLVLASRMDEDAHLSSNERSSDRKHRLSVVVETCLPEEISERVRVSCSDGSTWCTRQSECFDRILLDAPCSSERHVIQDPKYLNTWSPSRIKTVAMEQWALFSSAYRLLEPDGIMVYSTCALNPVENDEMIEKLIKKFNKDGKSFELLESKIDMNEVTDYANFRIPVIEKTKFGYHILPDTAEGAGPIYFSIVHKIQSIQS